MNPSRKVLLAALLAWPLACGGLQRVFGAEESSDLEADVKEALAGLPHS